MKIQMPEAVDVFALVTSNFTGLITPLGRLRSQTVSRPAARPLEQAVTFHIAPERGVRRHGASLGLLFHQGGHVVKMKLIAPTGMLPALLDQQLDELGGERRMLAVIGTDFAPERFHWPGLGTKSLVIPPLNGGQPEHHPFPGNGVAPLFGGQFLELPLQFAGAGRRRQKRSDDAEAKMRPALVGPAVLRFIFHTVSFLRFFRRFHWRRFASTTRADGRHLASCAGNPISLIQLAALLPREQ